MNEASLRQAIRRHYAVRELDPEKRVRIAAKLAAGPRRPISRIALVVGVAAAVVAAFLLGQVFFDKGDTQDATSLAAAVANEIAMNHVKHPDVDIESDSYDVVREQLGKLDFALVAPMSEAMRGLTLTGARYCSLQGHIAAQVRLRDEDGRRLTLYQVRDAHTFDRLEHAFVEANGLRVEIWREQGVLLGLARPVR